MAVAKKKTTKKAVTKKAVTKKAVTKKAVTKKAVAKKTSSKGAPGKNVALTHIIPEVPLGGKSISKSTRQLEYRADDAIIQSAADTQRKFKSRNRIFIIGGVILLASGVYIFSQRDLVGSSAEVVSTPSGGEKSSTPSTKDSTLKVESNSVPESIAPSNSPNPTISVKPSFLYTSTGIKISWITTGLKDFSGVNLATSEDGGPFRTISDGDGSSTEFDLLKVDNEGITRFRLTFTSMDGSRVTAPLLSIRGRFEK